MEVALLFFTIFSTFLCCATSKSEHCGVIQPDNGSVRPKEMVYVGKFARYRCNRGYKKIGKISRKCMQNGELSGKNVSCEEIRCSVPSPPINGFVSPSTNVHVGFHQSIEFSCPQCWTLTGNKTLKCLKNGKFSKSMMPACTPSVIESCNLPSPPEHGFYVNITMDQVTVKVNEAVKIECESDYVLFGNGVLQCGCDGRINGSLPICMRSNLEDKIDGNQCILPTPPIFGSLKPNVGVITVGTKIYFQCTLGYKLSGSIEMECGFDGSWIGDVPICRKRLFSTFQGFGFDGK